MVKNIVRDPFFLSQKALPADKNDLQIAKDLIDTLKANREYCVGMAANMIGVNKAVIIFYDEKFMTSRIMFNPSILEANDEYDTEEGCLSLMGVRKAKRHKVIKVRYQDIGFKVKTEVFTGATAQIIEHEVDHLNGILI